MDSKIHIQTQIVKCNLIKLDIIKRSWIINSEKGNKVSKCKSLLSKNSKIKSYVMRNF